MYYRVPAGKDAVLKLEKYLVACPCHEIESVSAATIPITPPPSVCSIFVLHTFSPYDILRMI